MRSSAGSCTALILLAALALTSPARAGAAGNATTPSDEVVAAIRARLDAVGRKDSVTWARFVADDLLAPLEGKVPSKQAAMAMHRSFPPQVKYFYGPMEDVRVRLHGDTAVAAYRANQCNDIGGQVTCTRTWQMETLMRRGKDWILVSVADAPIPLAPPVAQVSAAVLDDYAGDYEWAPGLVATIARRGQELEQRFGSDEPERLVAENDTTFFTDDGGGVASRYIFVKDATGRVSHYIYREIGATDRIVKKIR